MGKGGKVNCKRNFKRRVRSKDNGSDDSDEDYVVENEENVSDDDSEDNGISLDGYASEESFGSFVEEDEVEKEEEEEEVVRSKKNKSSLKNWKVGANTSRKRKRVSNEEEEDDDEDYVNEFDDEEEDDDNDDEDYDEEFTPEEDDDCVDEDEELTVKKNHNVNQAKWSIWKKSTGKIREKRRKSRVLKQSLAEKGGKKRRLRKKEKCEHKDEDDGDFIDNGLVVREKRKKNLGVRRRKYAVYSDSDFMPSGSSDYDYTISEEEREQVREASELYGDWKTSLRSSSAVKSIQENGDANQQRKSLGRKGKEKVKEAKSEVGKQVCGICLSEEDKRRLRGTLDCCSHFFCFTCIMEWSKVESRCPLCKQRFVTITKIGRSTVGVDLRNVAIQVPIRDQVYEPSEEEIRSFIDPYENVICTECREGGDDGLMLLCDLCDSPAHTYCVGLGRQVPEGNWYCDDCRPVALASSGSQDHVPLPDQRLTSNNMFNRPLPMGTLEGSGPTLESSPRIGSTRGFGNLTSPRFPAGDVQSASPISGAGPATLMSRRRIHRHIQNLLSISRMNNMAGRTDGISAAHMQSDLSNPQIDQGGETTQNSRTPDMGASQSAFLEERLQVNEHPSSSLQSRDIFSLRPGQLSRQSVQDPTITSADGSVNLTLWPELTGINSITGYEQFHQFNNRPSIVSAGNLSPYRVREESQFYMVKEQLQSMVKTHLQSLSRDIDFGHDTLKDIIRRATHTILAACGLEHKRSEVHTLPPPSICSHVDRMAAGQTSMMKGFCSSCFDSFVRDVVKRIMDTRMPQWLSLGL